MKLLELSPTSENTPEEECFFVACAERDMGDTSTSMSDGAFQNLWLGIAWNRGGSRLPIGSGRFTLPKKIPLFYSALFFVAESQAKASSTKP